MFLIYLQITEHTWRAAISGLENAASRLFLSLDTND